MLMAKVATHHTDFILRPLLEKNMYLFIILSTVNDSGDIFCCVTDVLSFHPQHPTVS